MISTTKDKKTGVVSVVIGGKTVATGTTDRTEARRIADLALQLQPLVNEYGLGKAPPVSQVIEEWYQQLLITREARTSHGNKIGVNAFAQNMFLTNTPINKVTADHIDKYVNRRDGTAAGTRRLRLSMIKGLLDFAVERKYCVHNQANHVSVKLALLSHKQKEVVEKRVFTTAEYNAILKYLDAEAVKLEKLIAPLPKPPAIYTKRDWLQAKLDNVVFWRSAVVLGRWTGLRLSDVAKLEWLSFAKRGKLTVHTDKSDKRVELKFGEEILNPEAVQHAVGSIPINDTEYCFPAQREAHHAKLSTYFKRICERAHVTGHSFHDLRATYLTEFVKAGHTIEHAAKAAGHSHISTTKGYIKE